LPLSKYPKVLYLFTCSDLKTILLPTVCLRLYPNPPHIDLSIDRFCLSLSPRHDCRPHAVRSVMDVVAHSSILRLESESEPRGRCTEQAMASHSFGHCIRVQCTDFTLDPPSPMSLPIYHDVPRSALAKHLPCNSIHSIQ
jgi:hypothetical protein